MKRLLSSIALVAALLASDPSRAAQQTVALAVENMTCAACPYIVRKTMGSVAGVTSVDVSYASKTAIVTFDDAKTTVGAIAQASANAGYPAKPVGRSR
jgi:mercuric ion binding protein